MFSGSANSTDVIPAGKTITWKFDKQISNSQSEVDDAESLGYTLIGIIGGLFVIASFIALFQGSLLSTWMFINSLQLIAHIPLVQANLPANLYAFMTKLLSLVRFDIEPVRIFVSNMFGGDSHWTSRIDFNIVNNEFVSYSTTLKNAGYSFSFINNMAIAIVLFGVICLVWAIMCAMEMRCV